MNWTSEQILKILDTCAEESTFPVLDNGYVYLAATRMSVYRSNEDWAIVIEVFGFSPRSGDPDVQIYTFSSKLHNRNLSSNYATEDAYNGYLKSNPYNESRFIYPIENDDWLDEKDLEYTKTKGVCVLRGNKVLVPELPEYQKYGIELEEESPLTFEFCRFLAHKYRDLVLCTEDERRVSVSPELELLLQLDAWSHPDISRGDLPSSSNTFKQVVKAIEVGSAKSYKQTKDENTHWVNWPDAGTL
ncbi:hypothetical protein ABT56_17460 [Photobacterium aquae]|uniref:Uncharacterized protein n=2 Tax=Photobacterium aquae TaxID=1195763 RepID=A0A0J1GWN8_9GAMM|nr:hypothetical protein ABT56_17460 [Photobacterium aquae]